MTGPAGGVGAVLAAAPDWTWLGTHGALFGSLLSDHVVLSLGSVLIAIVLAVPIGVACARLPRLYPPVLGVTSVLYALPSLALFVLLIDYTGLTRTTAIVPLTLYALTILVRAVVDGLRSVAPPVRLAAEALGYRPLRRLVAVELPLAAPVVIAGLRVAAVSNISLASVASLIGIGGLGQLFTDGFQRAFGTEIFAGIVLTVALALGVDLALVGVQRLATPWQRGRAA